MSALPRCDWGIPPPAPRRATTSRTTTWAPPPSAGPRLSASHHKRRCWLRPAAAATTRRRPVPHASSAVPGDGWGAPTSVTPTAVEGPPPSSPLPPLHPAASPLGTRAELEVTAVAVPPCPTPLLSPSPLEPFVIDGLTVYVKRDDAHTVGGGVVAGGKARKLGYLLSIPAPAGTAPAPPWAATPAGRPAGVAPADRGGAGMAAGAATATPAADGVTVDAVGGGDGGAAAAAAAAAAAGFPPPPIPRLPRPRLVSSGGAQSNAMAAVAALAAVRGWRFTYHTRRLPAWLAAAPTGNLATALAAGMELAVVDDALLRRGPGGGGGRGGVWGDDAAAAAAVADAAADAAAVAVPRGGASAAAAAGVAGLAAELAMQLGDLNARRPGGPCPTLVVLPGGTCTTAYYLARGLAASGNAAAAGGPVHVAVVPAVGGVAAAAVQMAALGRQSSPTAASADAVTVTTTTPATTATAAAAPARPPWLPTIVPPAEPAAPFGTPSAQDGAMYGRLAAAGLAVDLVYAPRTWRALLGLVREGGWGWDWPPPPATRLVYYHSGGLEGVPSMAARYRRAGIALEDGGESSPP